jgi:hypothetical protein
MPSSSRNECICSGVAYNELFGKLQDADDATGRLPEGFEFIYRDKVSERGVGG